MAGDSKLVVVGGNGAGRAAIEAAAKSGGAPPYTVMSARIAPFASVLCKCRNVPVFIYDLNQPGVCGVCSAAYYIGGITFDASAHFSREENQREGAPAPPVNISIVRVEPALVRPLL